MSGNRNRAGARKFVLGASLAVCAVLLLLVAGNTQVSPSRDALWQIVDKMCVPDQSQNHDPKPCTEVNLGPKAGFAILKDLRGETQYLLISTARISGIESPAILDSGATNYFASAWEARTYVEQALQRTLPVDDVSLAINSSQSRSQDQLHIHIDCVRPDVFDALHSSEEAIGAHWNALKHSFFGHYYLAMWVEGERLGANNPFQLLAEQVPGARDHMGNYTLVVVGLTRKDGTKGFVLLADRVNQERTDLASGEELQDHSCRIAR